MTDQPEWIAETLYPGWGQRFQVTRLLADETSAFQQIAVFESALHGRVMFLDGVCQITEGDESVYQEMMVHVPLIGHGAAQDVLIIGAGDGGVLRRVLQHRTVRRATMVEIDEAVIRLSKLHLPMIAGHAWDDPRATVLVGDGIDFVARAQDASFDAILVDSTDPIGPGESLFTDAFYRDCARALRPGGVLVNQCGVPFMQSDELRDTSRRRAAMFAHVSAYVVAVPTYVGGFMTLGVAGDTPFPHVGAEVARERAAACGILGTTRYWSPAMQGACFALPPSIAELLPGT